jgi:hypothetical protein
MQGVSLRERVMKEISLKGLVMLEICNTGQVRQGIFLKG